MSKYEKIVHLFSNYFQLTFLFLNYDSCIFISEFIVDVTN